MELLTEQHAAAHMTQAMNDIMAVGLTSKLTSLPWQLFVLCGCTSCQLAPGSGTLILCVSAAASCSKVILLKCITRMVPSMQCLILVLLETADLAIVKSCSFICALQQPLRRVLCTVKLLQRVST